jgi:PTS system nitrogen regulatory IIA component
LAIRECVNGFFNREDVVAISAYLDPCLVLFLESETRDDALREIVSLLQRNGKLKDPDAFYLAVLEREKIISTGIGLAVAVPHAKLQGYDEFFIAVGIQIKKGIEWNALDAAPVRLVFMIGGPDDKQTEYLKILSLLTLAIKNEERRKKLMKACSAKEVIDLFAGC